MRRILTALLAAAALLVVPSPASAAQFQFGLYTPGISHFEWQLDGMPSPQIAVNYQAWEQNPASLWQFADLAWSHGAETFAELGTTGCQCGNVTLQAVAAGQYDSYLRSFAEGVAAFGHPMLLTWDHEMNGTWYSWGAENYTPAEWVAAWDHVYTVIKAIAPNAVMVWAPNTEYGAHAVGPYWPGAAWVDQVGLDCYLSSAGQTFASQCGSTVAAIRSLTSDPLMLAETGIEADGHRPSQIEPLVQAVRAAGLTGLVWFDKGGSYLHPPGQRAMASVLG